MIATISKPLAAEELTIALETAKRSLPPKSVYLAELPRTEGLLHTDKLTGALSFDLENFGSAELLPRVKKKEEMLQCEDLEEALQLSRWQDTLARYIIVPKIQNSALEIHIFDRESSLLKSLPPYPLTGNLKSDFATIHKISDLITEHLFGQFMLTTLELQYRRVDG